MEKSKRLLTLIAIAAVLTISTVALALNGNWFSLILDPMGLDIPDISTEEALELLEMPQWFSSEVSMEGSGYSGQVHNVSVTIYHDRPSNGIPWLADGNYSLNLKLAGTIVEQILSGSFTNLGMWDPYTASYLWTPESPPDFYTIELNITNLSWKEMPTYTITATVGSPGGTIVSGPTTVSYGTPEEFTVLQGDPQGFTIKANTGYEISEIIVDGTSITVEHPTTHNQVFQFVDAEHTIEASFVPTYITMQRNGWNFTDDTGLFDGVVPNYNDSQAMLYQAGVETVNCSLFIKYQSGPVDTITSITYSFDGIYRNGAEYVNIASSKTISCSIAPGELFNFFELFIAPSVPNEVYTNSLHIESVTTTSP